LVSYRLLPSATSALYAKSKNPVRWAPVIVYVVVKVVTLVHNWLL